MNQVTTRDRSADDLDRALGRAIRVRRASMGMSQTWLANEVGVSFQQIQKYERGANRVSFSTLVRIARALGCGAADLAGEVDALKPQDDPKARITELLAKPDAFALLEAFDEVRSPRLRRAILDLARTLSTD